MSPEREPRLESIEPELPAEGHVPESEIQRETEMPVEAAETPAEIDDAEDEDPSSTFNPHYDPFASRMSVDLGLIRARHSGGMPKKRRTRRKSASDE